MRGSPAGATPTASLGEPDSVYGIGFDACNLYVSVSVDVSGWEIWGQGLSTSASAGCGAPYAFIGADDASTGGASVTAVQAPRSTCSD
jgi:hypothetical protein